MLVNGGTFAKVDDEDSKELNNEITLLAKELFPPIIQNTPISAAPVNEPTHDIVIMNIELNLVNYGSGQNEKKDEQNPLNVVYEESYTNGNQTGFLLNLNLNMSQERTFLVLGLIGLIISSVCVTIILARLQRKRLEKMSCKNNISNKKKMKSNSCNVLYINQSRI